MRQFLWLVVLMVLVGGCKEVTERGGAKVMPSSQSAENEAIEKNTQEIMDHQRQMEVEAANQPFGYTLVPANGDYDILVVTFNPSRCKDYLLQISTKTWNSWSGEGWQTLALDAYDCGLIMSSALAQYSSQFQFVDPITPIQSTSGTGSFTSGFVERVIRK